MKLEGSCHCGAVHFTVETQHPVPYQRCYCSICRKTQGGGGYAINISADARTLKLHGEKHTRIYHAKMADAHGKRSHRSTAERHFCGECGSALWLFSPEWPELLHPFASCIDSELPVPPEHTHLMVGSKPGWVEVQTTKGDKVFDVYPEESIAEWHERTGTTAR